MKKILTTILVIALMLTGVFALTACKKDSAVSIVKTEIALAKNAKFAVGDEFSTSKFVITVFLSDDTQKTPAAATLYYDTSALKLDDDKKFTTPGDFYLHVTYLDIVLKILVTVTA